MDKNVGLLIGQDTPQLNPQIADGLAFYHMKQTENYILSIFQAAAKGFPPGFTFVKGERCDPQEEFNEQTKKKNNRRQFDVATSDIYMMKYTFRFNGKDIIRYMYLPTVRPGGVIYLGGSRFIISPVLADRVISVGLNNIFIKLIRAKLTIESTAQHYMANEERETVKVVWSELYNKPDKLKSLKPIIKAHPTMGHYLFGKYGVTQTFQIFAGCTPVFGDHKTISRNEFPESEWIICRSTQVKPPKTYTLKAYTPTNICIAIRKSEYTSMVKNLVCTFFYIVDHFPQRVLPEYLGKESELRMWKILLGHLIFSSAIPEGKLADDIEDHYYSLDEYVDEIMKVKFKEIGMPVEDIYQVFAIVIERFNEWVLESSEHVSSMWNKELSILYYVLDEFTQEINRFYFKLIAASKKELTEKEIVNMMNQTLKTGLVFRIAKKHNEVSTISCSGDNKATKITTILIPQTRSGKQGARKDNAALSDPTMQLHVSVAEVGGAFNLPKSDPSGHGRLNPFVHTDPKGLVLRNPERAPLLDETQQKIKRM